MDLLSAHGGEFGRAAAVRRRCRYHLQGRRIRLLKPMTYMNDSGRAVAAACAFYKIPSQSVLVAYDELDIPPGRAKLRFNGGPGGHNGVRNVAECVGRDFWRLRLGIGHPGPGQRERVIGYVLRRPTPDEQGAILDAVLASADALEVFSGTKHCAAAAKTQLHSRHLPRTVTPQGTTRNGTERKAQNGSAP